MNASPDSLLQIIGKQQVMIEMLQEQLKKEKANGSGTGPDPHQPPAWAKATAPQES
jgi:hypothetical protein